MEKCNTIEERIREIQQCIRFEFLDTIRDPEELQRIYLEMVLTTTKELLLLFPTVNAIHRLERNDLMSILSRITEKGVHMRIVQQWISK